MKFKFKDDFRLRLEITQDEKKELLEDFSNNFTQAHKLMAWIEDPNVKLEERVPYFEHMFNIFNSLFRVLTMLLSAGVTQKEIVEALNDLPF